MLSEITVLACANPHKTPSVWSIRNPNSNVSAHPFVVFAMNLLDLDCAL